MYQTAVQSAIVNTCTPCSIDKCVKCNSDPNNRCDVCLQKPTPYFVINNKCCITENCEDCTLVSTCTKCLTGYYGDTTCQTFCTS